MVSDMSELPEHNCDRRTVRGVLGSRGLRTALIGGSLVDVVMGAGLMICPQALLEVVGMPETLRNVPDFWPRYVGVFLLVLPWFYLLPALTPARYRQNIGGAVYGRTLGCLFYLWCFASTGASWTFLVLSAVNLLFAVYYAAALARLPRSTSTIV